MPLVSVIMPVYNCERFVKESIDSILSQTYKDFEFIILNDGSTDGTWDIVKSYKDDKIILCDSSENIKIPRRRNQGIKMAKGKYIAIHDGDDISLPNRLELQVNFLETHPNVFCVGGHADKIDEYGKVSGQMDYPPINHDEIEQQYAFSPTNPIIDPTTMFRRDDFLEIGGYSENKAIYTVPDFDLWGRALLAGKKFANMMVKLIQYRINPDGMTLKNKMAMIRSHVMVVTNYHKSLNFKSLRKEKNGNKKDY